MYRSARTLTFKPEGSELAGCNYLQKTTFTCTASLLDALEQLQQWSTAEQVGHAVDPQGAVPADDLVETLIACGVLLARNSPEASHEERFGDVWDWGTPAALMHFTVQDNSPMSVTDAELMQVTKTRTTPPPALLRRHTGQNDLAALRPSTDDDLLDLMARRRTRRDVSRSAINRQALADCLYAGLGVVGHTRNAAGTLPLTMTPSGGARNPYEAFVLVQRVDGIDAGLHHYSAADQSLMPIEGQLPDRASHLVYDQTWVDDMACLVILCADFRRTMWKYDDANAYRVVLIEAGHIAQNIMLAATRYALTACPTAALRHREIAEICGLECSISQAPIYALAIGEPISNLER